jgi:hypothetical protein
VISCTTSLAFASIFFVCPVLLIAPSFSPYSLIHVLLFLGEHRVRVEVLNYALKSESIVAFALMLK